MAQPAVGLDLDRTAREALASRRGALVVLAMDGKVLALVNETIAQEKLPPGSVAKLVTAAAFMEERNVGPDHFLFCRGKGCWRAHGRIDLVSALAQSCSSTFYVLGSNLGEKNLERYFEETGFSPPEKKNLSSACGEGGLRISPLDLASFAVALANGGHLFRPYGGKLKNKKPRLIRALSWRPRTLEVLRAGMMLAISEGTAHKAFVPGTAIAGKTGTASRLDAPHRNYGWFLGFAPASRPRIAVCVLLNDATGYNEASSAARLVFSSFLKKEK